MHPAHKQARLPAPELELHVADCISSLLANEAQLFTEIGIRQEVHRHDAIRKEAEALRNTDAPKRWLSYRALIKGIVVRPKSVDIELDRKHLGVILFATPVLASETDEEVPPTISLSIPVQLYPTGHDLRLVINNRPAADEAGKQDPALMKWLARGRRWYQQLTSGQMPSLRAIAAAEGITERFVSRVISGSLLAPDIVEKVVSGRQPIRFTIKALKNRPPVDWEQQRQMFAMPGS